MDTKDAIVGEWKTRQYTNDSATSHTSSMRKRKYTKEVLEPIVQAASSLSEVLKALKLENSGGTHYHIKKCIREYGLTPSWLDAGHGWSKGQTAKTNESVAIQAKRISLPDDQLFSENAPASANGARLKKRLIAQGWEERCKTRENTQWMGQPIALEVDHINGVPNDNRKDNLRFLCPNCHRLTATWGRRKR